MSANRAVISLGALEASWTRTRPQVLLAGIVAVAGLLRSLAALAHTAPTYFPDEGIYAWLSSSLATSGHPTVRSASAHFPALLEPIVAAPLWLVGSTETAYRLVQVENALFMSLAAIPGYVLARRLGLSAAVALCCGTFAVAIPDLGFAGSILADPLAYPLVLAALTCGVVALEAPTTRLQLGFLAFAGLATATRVQYVVLLPAFVVASVAFDGRSAARTQRLPLALLGLGGAAIVALGTGRILGYYSGIADLHVGWGFVRWLALNGFFLSVAGGVVLVPGAVASLIRPVDQRDKAFRALVVPFGAFLMLEAAAYASNGSDQFKERYLFTLLPLLPIAYGLNLRRARPSKTTALTVAGALAIGALVTPLWHYTLGLGFQDSPLLWSVIELERLVGVGLTSPVAAALVVVAAVVSAALIWRPSPRLGLAAGLATVAVISVGATLYNVYYAAAIRQHLVANDPSWIDAAHVGPVSAIETPLAPAASLQEQLFWNRSLQRELLIDGATPTDAFASAQLSVRPDGALSVGGRPLDGALLFQGFAVTAQFVGARPVARWSTFTLWRPHGDARLRSYELGRYWDGWLAPRGGIELWPSGPGTLSFRLSLPHTSVRSVVLRFGTRTYTVHPGASRQVRLSITTTRPWSARFEVTTGRGRLADGRPVSVRSTPPIFIPA